MDWRESRRFFDGHVESLNTPEVRADQSALAQAEPEDGHLAALGELLGLAEKGRTADGFEYLAADSAQHRRKLLIGALDWAEPAEIGHLARLATHQAPSTHDRIDAVVLTAVEKALVGARADALAKLADMRRNQDMGPTYRDGDHKVPWILAVARLKDTRFADSKDDVDAVLNDLPKCA